MNQPTNTPTTQINPSRDTLRSKLKSKIGAKSIGRSSKQYKEHVLDETLAKVGIDRAKFQESYNLIRGLTPQQRLEAMNNASMRMPATDIPQ